MKCLCVFRKEKTKQNKTTATATTTAKQYTGTALTCKGFVKGTGIQSKAQKRFPRLQKIVMFLSEPFHVTIYVPWGFMGKCGDVKVLSLLRIVIKIANFSFPHQRYKRFTFKLRMMMRHA